MNMELFMRSMLRMYGFAPVKNKSETTRSVKKSNKIDNKELNIQDVDGVGPKYEEKLNDNGIESVSQLTEMSSNELSDKINISEDYANRWISSANELIN